MGSERSLWNTLRKNMKDYWEAERIENSVNEGTPDVYFTMKENGRGGWIELKHVHEWPKKNTTPLKIPHFTEQQKAFFKRHGKLGGDISMILQVKRDYFLLNYKEALQIGELSKKDLIESGMFYHWYNRIAYHQLTVILERFINAPE